MNGRSYRLLEGAVVVGRRIGQPGYDSWRTVAGVVAWILVLLIGFFLAANWQALPGLASVLIAPFR